MALPGEFSYFDKAPPDPAANIAAPLKITPGAWVTILVEGHDSGELDPGRAVFTRQAYAVDFTDANYPSTIKTRLVRFRATSLDYTAEETHAVSIDWATSHTVEMNAEAGVPVGFQMLVIGPAPIFLHSYGFRGVSLPAQGAKGIKATLQGLVAAMKVYVDKL